LLYPLVMSLVGAALIGVAGWCLYHFIGEPIARFFRYRDRIKARTDFYANVGIGSLDKARLEFRELATDLGSLSTSFPYATKMLSYLGYEPAKGAEALLGLSNEIHEYGAGRVRFRSDLERYLKLPPSYE